MMFAVTPNCKPYLFRFSLLDIIPIILKSIQKKQKKNQNFLLTVN